MRTAGIADNAPAGETQPAAVSRPALTGSPSAPLPLPAPAATPLAIDDVAARLDTIDRDLTNQVGRLRQQMAATGAAATAARGTKTDSEPWAKAQLELTRLERAGSAVGDLHGRLDAIAGTLAAAAASGSDVAEPLRTTGSLIARAVALDAEYQAAFSAASAAVGR